MYLFTHNSCITFTFSQLIIIHEIYHCGLNHFSVSHCHPHACPQCVCLDYKTVTVVTLFHPFHFNIPALSRVQAISEQQLILCVKTKSTDKEYLNNYNKATYYSANTNE